MVSHARLGLLLYRLYPQLRPPVDWEVEQASDGVGHLSRWSAADAPPTQEQVDSEAALLVAEEATEAQRLQQQQTDNQNARQSLDQAMADWSELTTNQRWTAVGALIAHVRRLERTLRLQASE